MAIQKHVHKLKRHKYSTGAKIYFCVLNCDYKISPALSIGKVSVCNRCEREFKLTEYSVRLDRPHCEDCHKSRKSLPSVEESRLNLQEALDNPPNSLADRLQNIVNQKLVPFHEEEDEI